MTQMTIYKQKQAKARRRMKCVMKVWTGDLHIGRAAYDFKATRCQVEDWCKTAMRGAKEELIKYV